ncbi:MAG: MCE family protein [Thermoleophilaceae bacterium]|nr:MCE family protein [Thermoleophilaceae bacterium]
MHGLKKSLQRYGVHLAAIVMLVVVSLGVAGYILSHQRLYLPAWVPVVGSDFYVVNAQFSSAQAVTPGQGQTVNIAGVSVGEIGNVTLKDGAANVELKIRRAHAPIYKDTQMLLKPRTPLSDMYIAMTPGTPAAGEVEEGGTVPLSNTKPTVNFDEFLSVLDSDTRDYLQNLLTAAGQGLDGQAANLRQGLKRFPTTGKYGTQIVKELQKRRKNIKRAITNLALLAETLGENSKVFASLIDSSSVTFRTWASQQESIRQIVQKAPGAFGKTADAVEASEPVIADTAVAFKNLQPLADDLGVSLESLRPFFRDQTTVTRDQLRPLARDSQPLLEQLSPAAKAFTKLTPDGAAATKSFNNLLNIVGYNPKGSEEGYLYWLSWFNHISSSSFNRADANGVLGSGALVGSDCDFGVATGAKNGAGGNPMLSLTLGLANLPAGGSCRQ